MIDFGSQQSAEKKEALEIEKLLLEKQQLQRQLSIQGILISWLQAASVPVALLGAILAFYLGFGQLRQGSDNQTNDRFDKALTRLASERPNDRLTGVSGLSLFLSDRSEVLRKQALEFLVNDLALETDERVRGAILDVMADLPPGRPSQAALNEGLRIAIERNRSLTRSIVDDWPKRIVQQKKLILAKFKIAGLDLDAIDQIPATVLAALTTQQYLSLLDAEHGPFQMLEPAKRVPLTSLSSAIETLVAHGASSDDFKGIYCENCKFSAAKAFDRTIFDKAYLANADFAHVSLREASFTDTDLGGTNFFGADLTGANLRAREFSKNLTGKGYRSLFPQLECAKLGGADLSGQPLVLFAKHFDTTSGTGLHYEIILPRMTSVQLDRSTKLNEFSVITAISITDDYLTAHTRTPEFQPLTADRSGPGWENPLDQGAWASAALRRIHATFDADASKYTRTIALTVWQYDTESLQTLAKDAFMLRWYIAQPTLRALPLYSQFIDVVSALSIPKDIDGKLAQALKDEATETWAKLKPLSCSGDEQKRLLDINVLPPA